MTTDPGALDRDVRLHILHELLERGVAPAIPATSSALGVPVNDVTASYDRLVANRILVMRPGTRDVLMAAPLSAVATPHIVHLPDGRSRYGNCVWDALGVLAMVGSDGTVDTSCADCNDPLELTVRGGALKPTTTVVHFAVPAARWWEDIAFT